MALLPLTPSAVHAQRLFEMEGIELRGSARVLQYGAGTCNVLEHVETATEYERKKANHGQPVDVWQLDLSVYNGSGKPLDHLIARYGIEAENPPCTNWTGPEAGQVPGPHRVGGLVRHHTAERRRRPDRTGRNGEQDRVPAHVPRAPATVRHLERRLQLRGRCAVGRRGRGHADAGRIGPLRCIGRSRCPGPLGTAIDCLYRRSVTGRRRRNVRRQTGGQRLLDGNVQRAQLLPVEPEPQIWRDDHLDWRVLRRIRPRKWDGHMGP